MGACICCFGCYEKFLRYVSGEAYSFMAVWGNAFYLSGQKAYFLKARNGHNVKELATAGNFTIWVF
jgi:hypothetical protein